MERATKTDSIVAAILSTSWHETVMQGEPQRRGSGLPGGNVLCRDAWDGSVATTRRRGSYDR